jgi:hypothetical protein
LVIAKRKNEISTAIQDNDFHAGNGKFVIDQNEERKAKPRLYFWKQYAD